MYTAGAGPTARHSQWPHQESTLSKPFPYWSQVVSTSAQKAAAAEILSRVREEVATRNAASMRGA